MNRSAILIITLLILAAPLSLSVSHAQATEFYVLNWQGYGSDEPWAIAQFEEAHNVTVVHDYFTSLDEMLTKLITSPGVYDAVEMNIAYLQPALEDGLIQPIDVSQITAWEDIPETFRNLPELAQGGDSIYGIPWTYGATSLVYNTDVFPDGINTLSVLWDPQFAGQVGMIDAYEDASILAGLYTGAVENPAAPTEDDIPTIQSSLETLAANVRTYWASEDEFNRLFESGEISLGVYWSGSAARARNAFNLPLEFVIPEEGAIGWVDVWTIAADAPNPELAVEWLNFMNDPEFYLEWDRVAGAPVPTNSVTFEQLPEDSYTRQLFSDTSVLDRLAFQTYIPAETREALLEMWQEVKLFAS